MYDDDDDNNNISRYQPATSIINNEKMCDASIIIPPQKE
jgi:hypothetical protein